MSIIFYLLFTREIKNMMYMIMLFFIYSKIIGIVNRLIFLKHSVYTVYNILIKYN